MPLCDKDNPEPTIKALTQRVEDAARRVVAMGYEPTRIQACTTKRGTIISVCYLGQWNKIKWISFPDKAPAE